MVVSVPPFSCSTRAAGLPDTPTATVPLPHDQCRDIYPTMPCAGGELCPLPNLTPKDNEAHRCRGGCGGRLHGTCGEVEDPDDEDKLLRRICLPCASAKKLASVASTFGKRKKGGATGGKQTPAKTR